jgi:large subunit ribosomal protein L4e
MAEKGTKEKKKAKKPRTKHKAPKAKRPRKVAKKVEKPVELGKVNLYSLDGKIKKSLDLPDAFRTEMRSDMIKRAVDTFRANRRQPYGPSPDAGMRHSVEQWGKGRGVARVQRVKNEFRGAQSPGTVGGRRAHPPKMISWYKKLNKKERKKAKLSALAATADAELVAKRGHRFDPKLTLPLVVDNEFEELAGTKDVINALKKLKVYDDVLRAVDGTHERAGRGKMRARRFREPRSLLVVVSDFKGLERGLGNLPGIDLTQPKDLNAELLAPGGLPGRLTIFTEDALETIRRWSA